MPKYLWQVNYTAEGADGLLAEGGSGRRDAVQRMLESVGGKLEVFYYALGSDDLVVIGELPDNVSAAALSLVTSAGGAARSRTTVLLAPEDIDEASRRSVEYRRPGADA
ncbi:GYD domain-containing protein [Nocardioides speluncae]|uniref:GYD domain-containing protein n=1 Tax=Nocardioides speluncae TaxID=2670337 RepID=UPI000D696A9D|nr:GYD domain-containing protein [Nocardioides speluncae]